MEEIRIFFGKILLKLNMGRIVEEFTHNALAVKIGSIIVLILLIAVAVNFVRKAKNRKIIKNDYVYYIGVILYLMMAFFIFNSTLYAVGNSVETILYIIALIIIPLILLAKYKDEQQRRIIKENEIMECKRLLNLQKEQIIENKKLYDNIRSIRHDLNDHIKTMEVLAANSMNKESMEYLECLKEKMGQLNMRSDTGNPYIDAILSEKERQAVNEGIRFMVSCEGKVENLKDPLSVCVVLNNSINNAIEACARINDDLDKIIDVSIICRKDVILVIKNTCDNIIVDKEKLMTTKEDKENHGLGFKNIEDAVKALGGILQWKHSAEEGQFTLMVNWCQ